MVGNYTLHTCGKRHRHVFITALLIVPPNTDREGQENLGGVEIFWDQGGAIYLQTLRGVKYFFMPHCQTFLINVIKRLLSFFGI